MNQSTLHAEPGAKPRNEMEVDARRGPALLGIGTATPEHAWAQDRVEAELSDRWRLRGAMHERWQRICRNAGVTRRCSVISDLNACAMASTEQRMRWYELLATPLAERAARVAMEDATVSARDVTDLVVVSCTGFFAPGVDVGLIDSMGLSRDVTRLQVGFMGCFGGIAGLRAAATIARANPRAVVLVVCVELCTLHLRDLPTVENMVGCALFGDGAAAMVVGGAEVSQGSTCSGRLGMPSSRLLETGREAMAWRITNSGFEMTLSPSVPSSLQREVRSFVDGAWDRPRSLAIHPGSASIIDAIAGSLDCSDCASVECAREILREHGNTSSAAVLFVLQRAFALQCECPMLALAFGPGLTIEGIELCSSTSMSMRANRAQARGVVR